MGMGRGGGIRMNMGGPEMNQRKPKKADPVSYPLNVTLEDLYTGTGIKLYQSSRRLLHISA